MSDLVSLLEQLVAINSVNPALDPDGPGETEIALFITDWCATRNLETHWIEPVPGRPSVVAIARGSGLQHTRGDTGGKSLMLNAHLDTVGVAGMKDLLMPRFDQGKLYGRGTCDMKASLAACLIALERAARLDLVGDVILTAVADEEHGSIGTQAVLKQFHADAAILTEPTGMQPCLAHRGFAVFDLELHGLASHTSQPELGVNAISALGRLLAEIEGLDRRLQAGHPHPLLGHGSAQTVRVTGGAELFTTPDTATATIERRTLPGETLERLEGEVQALLMLACVPDVRLKSSSKLLLHREPFEVDKDTQIVQCLVQASRHVLTREPVFTGAPYWMDSALLQAAGIPTVVYGPTAHGLHGPDEHVELEEVHALMRVLMETIRAFCG